MKRGQKYSCVMYLAILFFCGCRENDRKLDAVREDLTRLYGLTREDFTPAEIRIYERVGLACRRKVHVPVEEKAVYVLIGLRKMTLPLREEHEQFLKRHIDILLGIVRSEKYSLTLRQEAAEEIALLQPVPALFVFLCDQGIPLPARATGFVRLIHAPGLGGEDSVADFLRDRFTKEKNSGLRAMLAYRLLQEGDKTSLEYFIAILWISRYISRDAIERNDWGEADGKIPPVPGIPLYSYRAYDGYLHRYTGKSFETPEEWRRWYAANRDRLRWDGKQKMYVVE